MVPPHIMHAVGEDEAMKCADMCGEARELLLNVHQH